MRNEYAEIMSPTQQSQQELVQVEETWAERKPRGIADKIEIKTILRIFAKDKDKYFDARTPTKLPHF